MKYMTSGNETVDAMGMMNISGNVIPQIWYSTITRENGKPYLLAITLLGDIVYWYRPTEIRDERTGLVVGWKKRFRGDLLQKTYQQYADLYGESKRSIKAAMDRLEELGVIRKEFREVTCGNGMILNNVMYIGLNADVLNRLTYPERAPESEIESVVVQEEYVEMKETVDFAEGGTEECGYSYETLQGVVQNFVGGGAKNCNTLLQNNVTPPTPKGETNTKITTLTTDRDNINPIYQGTVATARRMDAMDMITAYTNIIRDNIEYDRLKQEYGPCDGIVDEITDLLVEMVSIERETVRIAGADYPYQLVKNRFLKLGSDHVRYVIDCMKKNVTQVDNIRAYLLTALYNAPGTIESYYQAWVNHDMYGRGV